MSSDWKFIEWLCLPTENIEWLCLPNGNIEWLCFLTGIKAWLCLLTGIYRVAMSSVNGFRHINVFIVPDTFYKIFVKRSMFMFHVITYM